MRKRLGREDRDHLQADDEQRADDRGHQLRGDAGAARADHVEQQRRHGHGNRGGDAAHREHDAIGAEPLGTFTPREHVDEGRSEQQRHRGDGRRHHREAHDEHAAERCGR
jgi:hypothetical protein